MWTIRRIDEADFGCEERMPGEPTRVLVTLASDDGRMCRFECTEAWLEAQGVDEGDEWPEDVDEVEAGQEDKQQMADWMENYYRAVSEMDEE